MKDEDDLEDPVFDAVDGVMKLLEVLVLTLGKSGALDTGEYARLLTDFRRTQVEPDSVQEAVIDRMLTLLVDRPDVLLRRSAFQLVSESDRDPAPTGPASDPES